MTAEKPWHVPGKWYTSPHNWHENVRRQMPALPGRVYIKDDTLREGEETPGVVLGLEDCIEIGLKLQEIGVAEMEMPMAASLEDTAVMLKELERAGITCPKSHIYFRDPPYESSTWKDDIDQRIDIGIDRIHLSIGYSREHTFTDFSGDLSKQTVEAAIAETVEHVKSRGIRISFGQPNQTKTLLDTLKGFHRAAADAGVDRSHVYDSLGVGTPASIRYLVSQVKEVVGATPVLIHVHNDFGMATANTLAGIEGGAEWCDLVANGLGDRGGNAPFEEVVSALEILYGVNTGIRLEKLYELSKLVEERTAVKCQPHKAIVGRNAFMEESAGHHRAMRQAYASGMAEGYLPYLPEVVGRAYDFIFGPTTLYGGAIEMQLDEWGLRYSAEDVERICRRASERIKASKKGYLTQLEFERLSREALTD